MRKIIIPVVIFIAIISSSPILAQKKSISLKKLPGQPELNSLNDNSDKYNEKRILLSFIIAMVNNNSSGYDDELNNNPYFLFNKGLTGEEVIDDFIKNTGNINTKIYGFTLIMIALIKHDYASMKKLLKAGADPYIDFSRADYYSIQNETEKNIAGNLIVCAYNRLQASDGLDTLIVNGKIIDYSRKKIFVSAYTDWIQINNITYKKYEETIFGEMINMADYLDPVLHTIPNYKKRDNDFVNACRLYKWEKVKDLLAQGTDINATNKFGSTALLDVLENKDYGDQPVKKRQMVKFLTDNGANVIVENYKGSNSFIEAYNNYKSSLPEYKEINKEIFDIIFPLAIKHEAVAIPLIATGYDTFLKTIDANPEINLHYKNPDNGKTALHEAIIRQEYEITKELLKRGAKLSDVSLNPLNYILGYINYYRPKTFDWIKLMVENGADINGTAKGTRPLEKAYLEDKYEIFTYLFENGADVNLASNEGFNNISIFESFLFNEKAEKYYELTKSEGKITINASRLYIQKAIDKNNTGMVRLFLDFDIDVSQVKIHNAVKNNNVEMVRLLINSGADLQQKDRENKKPEKYAQTKAMKNLLK
jgi:ankyrin repeat protein